MKSGWEVVIGLEVHVELSTKSKMFCRCSSEYFGHPPNTHTCPVCLGLPGALPVPNIVAIEYALRTGMALGCHPQEISKFDRKNYFYPDLPKGYQISQFDLPLSKDGFLEVDRKKIRISRVHMEEDTGKLVHEGGETLIDFNRSGVPLIEIVSQPDIASAQEAKSYAQKLQRIIRWLGVSDADMERGSMRMDANVSLKAAGSKKLGTKVEVKNLNSFRFMAKALTHEAQRQREILESGGKVIQETRGWDESKQVTILQRSKEVSADYRYFPEPDLPQFYFEPDFFDKLRGDLMQLPDKRERKLIKDYGISEAAAQILTRGKELADYFEEAVKVGRQYELNPRQVASFLINKNVDTETTLPARLVELVLEERQIPHIGEEVLDRIVKEVLLENKKAVDDYNRGRQQALMFLIGQVTRRAAQKLDIQAVRAKIVSELGKNG